MLLIRVRERDPEQTLRDIFANWLKQGKIAALLLPAVSRTGVTAPALISDPGKMDRASPLLPVMAVNAAKAIAEIAATGSPDVKLGVVLRPCEMRAVVELSKLQQVARENLILIGVDCPGTYKPERVESEVRDFNEFVRSFLTDQNRFLDDKKFRTACQMCEFPVPLVYDLTIGYLGLDPLEHLLITSASETANLLLDGLEASLLSFQPKQRLEYLSRLTQTRRQNAETKIAELDRVALGPENLVRYFANCLNCHNCMKVCPVCYCRQCFFDSEVFEKELDDYVRNSRRKGLARMPAGTMLYHLTRMNHMMTSCVQCGICEESCPVGIGLSVLYKKVSRNAQAEFDYVSGRSLTEPLPLATFREDEFKKIGEE